MYDRVLQALVKFALEPEWEAHFEPNSYGFRPGRSPHDAIGAIFNAIRYKAKYVLDADIAKCFDRIDHKALLNKLNTPPTIKRQVKAWLKAGVMDSGELFPTSEGTPQGGVISPLLANIALHGMENRIEQSFQKKNAPILIRYADDFVILHEDITVIHRCQQIIEQWLKGVGLELKPSKTRISHTLHKYEGNVGFDFLGFTIRQFPVGKHNSGKNTKGIPLGFKTIIKPSSESQKRHYKAVSQVINDHKAAPQKALISRLNPLIRGWSNYFSTVVSKEVYAKMHELTYNKLRAWANRRHPNKSHKWIAKKYWHTIENENWAFAVRKEDDNYMRLTNHPKTPIVRHTKVQGSRSPYDGDWIYWSGRMGKHPEAGTRMATLLKKQKGKCTPCGLYFKDGDLLEIDHKNPKSKGGRDSYENLQLLHRHCHDNKTADDNAVGTKELEEDWLDANPF